MVNCPLCGKFISCLHKRSHLIPEWMYKDCYDENHKMFNVAIAEGLVNKRQKGIYEEIICENCEKVSQHYDRYASLVLTTRAPENLEHKKVVRNDARFENINGKVTLYSLWDNIDFRKFQRFVFVCVLRAHLAEKRKGKDLLVEKHFDKMHEIYTNHAIEDDLSYPILVTKYQDEDNKGYVCPPFANKKDGHYFVEFSGAGYCFCVYVSSHKKPNHVNSMCLKKNGSMCVISVPLVECGTFKKAASTFSAHQK